MKQKKLPLILLAVSLIVVLAAAFLVLFFIHQSNSEISSSKVLQKCPFELSDNAEWRFYPSDNLVGFVALAHDYDETDQTFVLVFNHSPKMEDADGIILNGNLGCECFYDSYAFDNQEIVEQGSLYYMKMRCDKRIIVVSFRFYLENGDVHKSVKVEFFGYDSVPKMQLHYWSHDYGSPYITVDKTQLFNEETGSWDEIEDVEKALSVIQHGEGMALQVDDDKKHSVTRDRVTIDVNYYEYMHEYYDVYHEPRIPQVTTLKFSVSTPLNLGVEKIEAFDINNIRTEDIRLYVREGNEYIDITPGDFCLETEGSLRDRNKNDVLIETRRFFKLNSNELGELGEHNYRLVIEGFPVDFTLTVQYFSFC